MDNPDGWDSLTQFWRWRNTVAGQWYATVYGAKSRWYLIPRARLALINSSDGNGEGHWFAFDVRIVGCSWLMMDSFRWFSGTSIKREMVECFLCIICNAECYMIWHPRGFPWCVLVTLISQCLAICLSHTRDDNAYMGMLWNWSYSHTRQKLLESLHLFRRLRHRNSHTTPHHTLWRLASRPRQIRTRPA